MTERYAHARFASRARPRRAKRRRPRSLREPRRRWTRRRRFLGASLRSWVLTALVMFAWFGLLYAFR